MVEMVFDRSIVPLAKWVLVVHFKAVSKKGMSTKQIERMLGVIHKSARFMMAPHP